MNNVCFLCFGIDSIKCSMNWSLFSEWKVTIYECIDQLYCLINSTDGTRMFTNFEYRCLKYFYLRIINVPSIYWVFLLLNCLYYLSYIHWFCQFFNWFSRCLGQELHQWSQFHWKYWFLYLQFEHPNFIMCLRVNWLILYSHPLIIAIRWLTLFLNLKLLQRDPLNVWYAQIPNGPLISAWA